MLPTSPTTIRLGWKGLSGTNTLAYYENPQIIAVKSFIVQALVCKKPCHYSISCGCKGLTGTNTLAYFTSSSVMKEKSLITLITGVNGMKNISSPLTKRKNKLESK
jgi:hypothetical protein